MACGVVLSPPCEIKAQSSARYSCADQVFAGTIDQILALADSLLGATKKGILNPFSTEHAVALSQHPKRSRGHRSSNQLAIFLNSSAMRSSLFPTSGLDESFACRRHKDSSER